MAAALIEGGSQPGAVVTIDEQPAMTLLTTMGGMSAMDRAQLTAARLRAVVDSNVASYVVGVQQIDDENWAVTLQGGLLIQISQAEAAAHGSTITGLAKQWQTHVVELLSQPPIEPSTTDLIVPLGETRTVMIAGAARPPDIAVSMNNGEVVAGEFDPDKRQLVVKGLACGTTVLTLESDADGPATAEINVAVEQYAAHVDTQTTIEVTGSPTPPAIAERAFFAAVAHAVTPQPGAIVAMAGLPSFTSPLDGDQTVSNSIGLRASGPGLLPVKSSITVSVHHADEPAAPAAKLFYSNNPERVTGSQELFTGRFYPDVPVRIDYHHQNISAQDLGFHVDLVNNHPTPVDVQVLAGVADPGIDTIQVGRRAGVEFMQAYTNNAGIVLHLPPYSISPVVAQHFPSLYTVSGLMEMRIIGDSGPAGIHIYTSSDNPAADPVALLAQESCLGASGNGAEAGASIDTPPDCGWAAAQPSAFTQQADAPALLSPSVFRWPHIEDDAAYTVGGQWTYLTLGHNDPLHDDSGTLVLDGNYGVDYDFTLTLNNPTPLLRPVGLYFAPAAGTAAGAFSVDGGALVEFDPLSPPDEALIARVDIAPGATRTMHIWTIPLNGSYYPASIVVHTL